MRNLLELHIVQSFAPSLLNRDDTGSPKECEFGGVRRARISSQCLKRSVRQFVKANGLIPDENMAIRSKRLVQEVAERLRRAGRGGDVESAVARALASLRLAVDNEWHTQYLLFLGNAELDRLASAIGEHWEVLTAPAGTPEGKGEKASGKKSKKEGKASLPDDLVGRMEAVLDGGKAVDIALFGRMLADVPKFNMDASCQVAHALSTHAVNREFDFFTAVDDLRSDDTSGADMLGTVEFSSACFYRYALIDLDQLVVNLHGDRELAAKGATAFVQGFVNAVPTGKQNTFAAHNRPSFVGVAARRDGTPRSLSNAFEKPVRAGRDSGLVLGSLQRLDDEWARQDSVWGSAGEIMCLSLETTSLPYLGRYAVPAFELLMTKTEAAVTAALDLAG